MATNPTASKFTTVTPSVLAKLNDNDQAVWQIVCDKYSRILRAELRNYWLAARGDDPDPEIIEDALGDTWKKVLLQLPQFVIANHGGGFRSNLRTVARRQLIDRWRKAKRRDEMTSRLRKGWLPPVSSKGHSLDIEQEELLAQIRQCAQELQDAGEVSEERMNIFFAAWKGDLSPTEIARRYRTSSANVNQIKCRINELIRERLGTKYE